MGEKKIYNEEFQAFRLVEDSFEGRREEGGRLLSKLKSQERASSLPGCRRAQRTSVHSLMSNIFLFATECYT